MRTASLLDAASNESTSNTDLLDANESTWAFVAVGCDGCVLRPQVEAFVSGGGTPEGRSEATREEPERKRGVAPPG